MMGRGWMMHGLGLFRDLQVAMPLPDGQWLIFRDEPSRQRPGILPPISRLNGDHGDHHPGGFDLGGTPRDGSPSPRLRSRPSNWDGT
jgi:hypothetical protein